MIKFYIYRYEKGKVYIKDKREVYGISENLEYASRILPNVSLLEFLKRFQTRLAGTF